MVFSSQVFLFGFLPAALLLYFVSPPRLRNLTLTLTSYIFYGWASPFYLLLIAWSTVVDYCCGNFIGGYWRLFGPVVREADGRPRASEFQRRVFVGVSLVSNLGLLGFFKYGPFIQANYRALASAVAAEPGEMLKVLVPLPGKAPLYPEYFASAFAPDAGPAQNRGLKEWEDQLRSEGVNVVDVVRPLWDAKSETDKLLCLKIDSHWSPTGLAVAADAIAAAAEREIGKVAIVPYTAKRETVKLIGDQISLLDLQTAYRYFPKEEVTITRVEHDKGDGDTGNQAPVLLIGDSYTTMFREYDADLPSQLRLRLGRGVQTIAAVGTTPAAMLRQLGSQPEALAQKKLVIWTFVDRTINKAIARESVRLPAR
jgi:hypothetical protein